MKKLIAVMIIVVTVFMVGCQGEVIPELQIEGYEKVLSNAHMAVITSNIDDIGMLSKHTRLIAKTLEKGNYTVRFIFHNLDEEKTYELEPISFPIIFLNDREYIELISANLKVAILQQVGDAHGNIVGSIVNWKRERFLKGPTEYFVASLYSDEWSYGSKCPISLWESVDNGPTYSSLDGNLRTIEVKGGEKIRDLEKILDKK